MNDQEHRPIVDYTRLNESFELKEGLNAIFMPKLVTKEEELNGNQIPFQPWVALSRVQVFLDEIDKQGGEVVGILPVRLLRGREYFMSGHTEDEAIEERQVFIVRKHQE